MNICQADSCLLDFENFQTIFSTDSNICLSDVKTSEVRSVMRRRRGPETKQIHNVSWLFFTSGAESSLFSSFVFLVPEYTNQ